MKTRVIGYVRVSTVNQAEQGVSLDAQREKITAYARAMDLDLVGIEGDEGVSAKSLDRPGLQRALAMLREKRADAILVAKLDRLTRSVVNLGVLLEKYFADGKWGLLSVGDSIDTRSAAGRLVLNMLASVSQWEREAIAERTRDALAHLRKEGVALGGEALGWRRTDELDADGRRVVEPVDDEIAAVRRIEELRLAGYSYREIAARLAADGFKPKRGTNWNQVSVMRVCKRRKNADEEK